MSVNTEDYLASLRSFERETESTVIPSSDRSLALAEKQRFFLSLSKALTGNDTCAAIYECDLAHFPISVSNNTNDRSHFDRVIGILRQEPLDRDELKSALAPTLAYQSAESRGASSMFEAMAATKRGQPYASRGGLDEYRLDRDIDIIAEGMLRWGTGAKRAAFISEPDGPMHAEIRMLPSALLDARTRQMPDYQSSLLPPTIITSKLLCNPCNIAVDFAAREYGVEMQTVGTHAKNYTGWVDISLASIGEDALSHRINTRVREELTRQFDTSEEIRAGSREGHRLIGDEPAALKHIRPTGDSRQISKTASRDQGGDDDAGGPGGKDKDRKEPQKAPTHIVASSTKPSTAQPAERPSASSDAAVANATMAGRMALTSAATRANVAATASTSLSVVRANPVQVSQHGASARRDIVDQKPH